MGGTVKLCLAVCEPDRRFMTCCLFHCYMILSALMKTGSTNETIYRKRCRRWNRPCHVHALTFSCFHNRPFLQDLSVCAMLADSLSTACARHNLALWAFVFMPEHVHLLVWPRQVNYSISTFLQAVKQPLSRRVIRFHKKHQTSQLSQMATGQKKQPYRFWQAGGGYDRNIVGPDTAWNVMHYIHQNPVRRKLVEYPNDWFYSSYKDWHTDETGPMDIDKPSFYVGTQQSPRPSTA
ncbi:MAG: REP-associated tyrosine transposase [Planctomycetota bacterium]